MRFRNLMSAGLVLFGLIAFSAASALATTYNEATSTDLSGNKAAPSTLTLTAGSNSIIGTVGGADFQDWIALTVPAGMSMTSYTNSSYTGSDAQGFTGFQLGATFGGDPGQAPSYAGYAHFGTGATNPSVNSGLPLTTVGVNLLPVPYMADNGSGKTAQLATGFTQPLGPGTYTFLIQQSGGAINYQFDMNVVPEPSTLCLIGLGGMLLLAPAAGKLRRKS